MRTVLRWGLSIGILLLMAYSLAPVLLNSQVSTQVTNTVLTRLVGLALIFAVAWIATKQAPDGAPTFRNIAVVVLLMSVVALAIAWKPLRSELGQRSRVAYYKRCVSEATKEYESGKIQDSLRRLGEDKYVLSRCGVEPGI